MSLTPQARVKELILGIRLDMQHYAQLEQLLVKQRTLLAAHDVDALNSHNKEQMALMQKIGQQAQLRSQHLQALGLKPSEKGMQKLIARLPENFREPVASQWQQLEQSLARCQAHNDSNGRLLASQIETIQGLLGHQSPYGKHDLFHE
ncbi:MAG: flagellar protein FlgN [Aeromonas sp.]